VREIAELVELCQQHGKRLVTCWDGIDTDRTGFTANAIADINFRAVLAQYQSDNTSDLMRQTSSRFRDVLGIPWGMWPFGMSRVGKGKETRLLPDPVHGPTVVKLLTWYAAGGSYDVVAEKLNDHQLRHLDRDKLPKRFAREGVRAVVGNVLFYAGYIVVGKRWKAKTARVELEGEGTYLERYARALGAIRSAAIEPLIGEDLANAVIERRHKNQYAGRKPATWIALLTPIAFWRDRKLRADSGKAGNFYHTRGSGPWINGDRIDEEIIERLSGIEFPPEMRAIIRDQVASRLGDTKRAEATQRIDKLQRQMETLIALLLDEKIQRDYYDRHYAEIERGLRVARADLTREDDVERVMAQLGDLCNALVLMTAENRKRAVHKLFERVHFDDEGQIERIELRDWARQAFGDIAFAWRLLNHAKGAPGEQSPRRWHSPGLAWLIDKAA
jgi:hypothetical protein